MSQWQPCGMGRESRSPTIPSHEPAGMWAGRQEEQPTPFPPGKQLADLE